jgi:hypothetical protein
MTSQDASADARFNSWLKESPENHIFRLQAIQSGQRPVCSISKATMASLQRQKTVYFNDAVNLLAFGESTPPSDPSVLLDRRSPMVRFLREEIRVGRIRKIEDEIVVDPEFLKLFSCSDAVRLAGSSCDDAYREAKHEQDWQLQLQDWERYKDVVENVSTYNIPENGCVVATSVLETEPAFDPDDIGADPSPASPKKRTRKKRTGGGPRRGDIARYNEDDKKYCPEIHQLVSEKRMTKTAAARQVVNQNYAQIGGGMMTEPESKVRRLLIAYKSWLESLG